MYFKEFYAPDDDEHFVLVSNHGGISITYDESESYRNIGMNGLNAGQYYSVRTDPNDPRYIYVGSQDQGYQRGFDPDEEGSLDFTQVIGGDYGHLVFSENGTHLWMVYPAGTVSFYDAPQTDDNSSHYYTLNSENESVWLPPLAESGDHSKNEIYMAGGNLDGGPGSFMIKLGIENGDLIKSQFSTDFLEESGKQITAIAFSPLDPDLIYVGTGNTGVLTSKDGGISFTKNAFFGPLSTAFSGNSLHVSKVDDATVYYAGSGYYGPAIYVSYDYGETFTDASEGLPKTVIVDLDANEDETLIFAATEAGPFVYDVEEKIWHSMAGLNAPTTRFYSVEFLSSLNKVRFGTFGRGIWDFDLLESLNTNGISPDSQEWTIFPNPAIEQITIQMKENFPEVSQIEILSIDGKVVYRSSNVTSNHQIDISPLIPGQYIVQVGTANNKYSKSIIKQ